MATNLPLWTTDDHSCEYLPGKSARMEYAFAPILTGEEYETRMNDGWRKFGHLLFHPVCAACDACQPIRIPVTAFTPDRGQRRTLDRCGKLFTIRTGRPAVDPQRLDLYNRYHASQEGNRGWSPSEKTEQDYAFAFVQNPVPAIEISVWEGEILRAVVLTDITPNVVSGVYHFYEPDLRPLGIGVFAMLQTIALAQTLGKTWAYFGFYVAECPSLSYKARFRPCELLGSDGIWREFTTANVTVDNSGSNR